MRSVLFFDEFVVFILEIPEFFLEGLVAIRSRLFSCLALGGLGGLAGFFAFFLLWGLSGFFGFFDDHHLRSCCSFRACFYPTNKVSDVSDGPDIFSDIPDVGSRRVYLLRKFYCRNLRSRLFSFLALFAVAAGAVGGVLALFAVFVLVFVLGGMTGVLVVSGDFFPFEYCFHAGPGCSVVRPGFFVSSIRSTDALAFLVLAALAVRAGLAKRKDQLGLAVVRRRHGRGGHAGKCEGEAVEFVRDHGCQGIAGDCWVAAGRVHYKDVVGCSVVQDVGVAFGQGIVGPHEIRNDRFGEFGEMSFRRFGSQAEIKRECVGGRIRRGRERATHARTFFELKVREGLRGDRRNNNEAKHG